MGNLECFPCCLPGMEAIEKEIKIELLEREMSRIEVDLEKLKYEKRKEEKRWFPNILNIAKIKRKIDTFKRVRLEKQSQIDQYNL